MTRTAILTALMLAALTAAASPELYLRGTCTGWDALGSHKFHATANPDIQTLHLDNVYGEFKIADANFSSAANFGGFNPESDDNLTVGEGVWQLVSVAPNFIIPQMNDVYFTVDRRNPAKITLTISHDPFVVPETHVPEFSDYYLRGNLHGHFWECDNSLRFTHTGLENVYQLRLAELHGDFKIANSDWSKDYGADSFATGTAMKLKERGGNITAGQVRDAVLTLDMSGSEPTLTVTGDTSPLPDEPSGIFLFGSMRDSDGEVNELYEFRHAPGSPVHTLRIPSLHGEFRVRSRDLSMILGAGKENGTVCEAAPEHTYRLEANGPIFYTKGILDACLTLDMTDPAAPTFSITRDTEATARWKESFHEVYREDFSGTEINPDRWTVEDGVARWAGAMSVFTPRPENVRVADGALILTARREDRDGFRFTSGAVHSHRKLLYRQGKLEISAMMPPTGNGLVCGLWLMGETYSWPFCGEVDIIEIGNLWGMAEGYKPGTTDRTWVGGSVWCTGDDNTCYTSHYAVPTAGYSVQDGKFHTYTYYWDDNRLAMYLDEASHPDADPYYVLHMPSGSKDKPYEPAAYLEWPYFIYLHIAAQALGEGTPVNCPDDVTALNNANGQKAEMRIDYISISQRGGANEELISRTPSDTGLPAATPSLPSAQDNTALPVTYYDMMGKPVRNPVNGIYIRTQGTDRRKIIINGYR